jgi:ribosomally synthesized peptide (two-chain TOMM family)
MSAASGGVSGSGIKSAVGLDGELMSFRTAWLRAVAYCWAHQELSDKLEDDPKAFLWKMFNFDWPWKDTIDFTVNRGQGLKWCGDDWVWPSDNEDSLLIRLPITRGPKDPGQIALALADYYAQRPSIFGTAAGGGSTPRGQSLITSAGLDVTDVFGLPISEFMLSSAPVRFAGNHPPPGGFMPSSGSFADFEVVLISALAKAWNNKTFADLIQADKDNVVVALQTIRGYTSPWRLTLKIEDDDAARWDGETLRWTTLSPHLVALNLPDRPTEINDQGVALAAYNSTGAAYPFTCCA